jgi:hypothetical protein
VAVVPHPEESSGLSVVAPDQILDHARPLPSDDEMAIEDLSDDEWEAFERALADR